LVWSNNYEAPYAFLSWTYLHPLSLAKEVTGDWKPIEWIIE